MQVTATEVGRGSRLDQLVNQATFPTRKWFLLFSNELDGTFHPLPKEGTEEVGWWGTTLADSNGYLTTPPEITVTFDEIRVMHAIWVSGNPNTGSFPVNFTVEYFNGPTLLGSVPVSGNQELIWKYRFPGFVRATSLKIRIHRISTPNQPAQLMEMAMVPDLLRKATLTIDLDSHGEQRGPKRVQKAKNLDVYHLVEDGVWTPDPDGYGRGTTYAFVSPNLPVQVPDPAVPGRMWRQDVYTFPTPALPVRMEPKNSLTVQFKRSDDLIVDVDEVSIPENIHTAMNSPQRQVFARVVVSYTDIFNDESIQYSSSETGRGFDINELGDSLTEPAFKWFSLTDNRLDGTFHVLPSDRSYSVGWWGASLSDDEGYMPEPPTITVTFAERTLTTLKLVGDSKLNNYPVDFEFRAYNEDGDLLFTETVNDNDQVYWIKPLDVPVGGVTRLEARIFRINQANSVPKLTEFFTAVEQTYEADMIESLRLLEEIGYNTGGLPIGNLSANEIDVTLSNMDRRFDLDNTNSSLHGYIKRNRRVQAWLGAYVGEEIEWHPLGTFWTTSWDIRDDSLTASFTARDRLELLRQTEFTNSRIYKDHSLAELFRIVFQDAGLFGTQYNIDSALEDIVIPYAWFEKGTHRQALQRLASSGLIQVFCDRYDVIQVTLDVPATQDPITIFDEDVNVFTTQYPLAVTEQVNTVEVIVRQWGPGQVTTLYEGPEDIELDPGETFTETYEFTSTPVLSVEELQIETTGEITVQNQELYSWGIEVTFHNSGSTPGSVTSVLIEGTPLEEVGKLTAVARDEQLIREDGKNQVTIEHDFIQRRGYAKQLAETTLETYKLGRRDVVLSNRGNVAIHLGHRVLLDDPRRGIQIPYTVFRQNYEWAGYLQATTEGKKL